MYHPSSEIERAPLHHLLGMSFGPPEMPIQSQHPAILPVSLPLTSRLFATKSAPIMRNIPSVRMFLQNEYESILRIDSGFSMRKFAAEGGVSVSFLSRVLGGHRHVSHNVAAQMAGRFKWETKKTALFLAIVSYEEAPEGDTKSQALARLSSLSADRSAYSEMAPDLFAIISKWHHSAILEMASCPDFSGSPRDIARSLGITAIEVDLALDRLRRVGALEKLGETWHVRLDRITTGGVPSAAIRGYHQQVLNLASHALEHQSMERRDFSGVTMAIDPKRLPEARVLIQKFRRELTELLNSPSEVREIFQLSVQLFQLDDGVRKPRAESKPTLN